MANECNFKIIAEYSWHTFFIRPSVNSPRSIEDLGAVAAEWCRNSCQGNFSLAIIDEIQFINNIQEISPTGKKYPASMISERRLLGICMQKDEDAVLFKTTFTVV